MLRSCLRPTGDYFAWLLFHDDAEPLMKRIDELVVHTKQACFGQDVSAEGPLGPRNSPFKTIPNQSQFQCFSRPCASFRMSSILVASVHILASMRILSCSAHPRFGAVTCVSHVLWCARARCRLPSDGSAGLQSRPCPACGTPCMRSGTPRASCSSVSADRRSGHSGPHPQCRRAQSASLTV